MTARIHAQLALPLPAGHGGARPGSGPRPRGRRPGVSHHGRPEIHPDRPIHVTLRVLPHVWNLRSRRSMRVVEGALRAARDTGRRTAEFRVAHFAVEGNHLHLVVEAGGPRALAEGMQGLSVRLAKGLNRLMGRRGRVLADRYHARPLASPGEVRRALAYVLLNHRSHAARRGERLGRGAPDPCSSAAAFDGWREAPDAHGGAGLGEAFAGRCRARTERDLPVARPETWLLSRGWRRRGLLSLDEVPAEPAHLR